MTPPPDIAGFYITDDFIDAVLGNDPDRDRKTDRHIRVEVGEVENTHFREPFEDNEHPEEAVERLLRRVHKSLSGRAGNRHLRSVCIGAHGPFVSITPDEEGYGQVRPIKPGRRMNGINIRKMFLKHLDAVFGSQPETLVVETDVACAALGEAFLRYTDGGTWLGDFSSDVLAFIKISNGVGGALCQAANPVHGQLHSEMGQILVRKWRDPWLDPHDDEARFEGADPYTGRLESLISLPAIEERFGASFDELKALPDHPAWHRQAWYLAQLCLTVTSFAAPSDIVLGGRVMGVQGLLERLRLQFRQMLGVQPYPNFAELRYEDYISHDLGWNAGKPGRPGMIGALVLAAVRSRRVQLDIGTK